MPTSGRAALRQANSVFGELPPDVVPYRSRNHSRSVRRQLPPLRQANESHRQGNSDERAKVVGVDSLPPRLRGLLGGLPVLLPLPPLPRGDGGGVSPQPAALPAGVGLKGSELVAAVVGGVAPCQTASHHLGVDQLAGDADVGDHAPVSVLVDLFHRHRLPGDQIGEGLPADGPESLLGLGGVDPVKPNFDLPVLGVQPGEGVAIGDPHHLQVGGAGGRGEGDDQGEVAQESQFSVHFAEVRLVRLPRTGAS